MTANGEVTLKRTTQDDAVLLSNLLELYMHDLSDVFSIDIGAEGRYGYSRLPLYWTEPETRFAFLINTGGRVAGFILATRGSPMSDDPESLDVAEFFVLRRYRRAGVGRHAARLLWDDIPGQWIVRVAQSNRRALYFWESVIREYTQGEFSQSRRSGGAHEWLVFSFGSNTHERTSIPKTLT